MTVRLQSHALSWAREDIIRSRTLRRLIGVSVFAVATALAARLAIPLPGTPVPFTLQVLCVILAGATLGSRLGAASQLAYLAAGALGAPIFAAGGGLPYLLGPTGGYLLAFPVAAYAVGAVAGRSGNVVRLAVGLAAGVAIIHAGGMGWLLLMTGSLRQALRFGVLPFLALDVVKVVLALFISVRVRTRALELF